MKLWLVAWLCLASLAGAQFSTPRTQADMAALLANGPRVAGTPAAQAAANYLAQQLQQAGYSLQLHPFTYSRERDLGSFVQLGERRLEGNAIAGSPAGTVEAELVVVPGVGQSQDYAGLQVTGKAVVVRRGVITFLEKARIAAQQGAVALLILNNQPGGLLGTFAGDGPIPALGLDAALEGLLQASQGQPVRLEVRTQRQEVQGRNLIAKKSERPQAIVGAHYDSVPGSPGANDNASGTVTVLELARTLANTPLAQKVWFVFFDGEEDGLWGSRRFVSDFQEVLLGLKAMLNLDMVGVQVGQGLGVGGDNDLLALLSSNPETIRPLGSSGGSDHVPFAQAGVPVLFFHRGLDANYHRPTDQVVQWPLLASTALAVENVLNELLLPR